jgi:hypothetical protein
LHELVGKVVYSIYGDHDYYPQSMYVFGRCRNPPQGPSQAEWYMQTLKKLEAVGWRFANFTTN